MEEEEKEFFEISAVSRLTGISPHVLRVWERRYSVVEPKRSETKRRNYSTEDIQRLALLKTLVDNGHAIGSVANLSTSQLEDRLAAVLNADCDDGPTEEPVLTAVVRVAFVGTKIRQAVRDAVEAYSGLAIVGEFKDANDFTRSFRRGAVDVLILEQDSVFAEDIEAARKLLAERQLRRIVLVYHFAGEDVIRRLNADQITALRAPVDTEEIRLACAVEEAFRSSGNGLSSPAPAKSNGIATSDPPGEIPGRAFSEEQLLSIAKRASAVDCECPRHLAGLITGLFAFEQYSERCASRNEQDAALHAYLHRSTAQCRAQMEDALAKVLSDEGISV